MPANNSPIFSSRGSLSTNDGTGMAQAVLSAANDYTGAGANNFLVWTATAANGGFLQRVRMKSTGTNVASAIRFFFNNGSTPGTGANNEFYDEFSLPATTTGVNSAIECMFNLALDPGFRLYAGLVTAVAGGWVCTPIGGKYTP